MKKAVGLVVLAGFVFAVARAMKRGTERGPDMWQRMQHAMEAMPEDFPPRMMFDNTAATRENTERILEILQERSAVEV